MNILGEGEVFWRRTNSADVVVRRWGTQRTKAQ